jgi:hypothetical protein
LIVSTKISLVLCLTLVLIAATIAGCEQPTTQPDQSTHQWGEPLPPGQESDYMTRGPEGKWLYFNTEQELRAWLKQHPQ